MPSISLPRIALVGLRCTGKTTLGKALAKQLGWDFLDTDEVIATRAQKTVASIFKDEGESVFRRMELEALKGFTTQTNLVLSCGGGIVVTEGCREILKRDFQVAWLTATPETLAARMRLDPKTKDQRPSLTGAATLEDEFRLLLQKRTPWYTEVAKQTLDATLSTEAQVQAFLE